MKTAIEPKNAPAPVGPYSRGIVSGPFLFCSGQIALNAQGELVSGGVVEQTKQVMENIKALLGAKGLTFDHVVKTTIFLTSMGDFTQVNEIYAQYFNQPYPARSTVAVAGLPKGAVVEIEVLACLNG